MNIHTFSSTAEEIELVERWILTSSLGPSPQIPKLVLSDGTALELSAQVAQILRLIAQGFSAVSLRDSIERPEALESGSMILTGVDPATLLQAIEIETTLRPTTVLPEGYETFEFSNRVLKFLMSTAGKHKTWKGLHA